MRSAVVNHAEKSKELRPSSVALVHSIRETCIVLPEALEKPSDRVVVHKDRIERKQPSVLSVENKDQSHEAGEKAAINVGWIFLQRVLQQLALGCFIRSLKTTEQLV